MTAFANKTIAFSLSPSYYLDIFINLTKFLITNKNLTFEKKWFMIYNIITAIE